MAEFDTPMYDARWAEIYDEWHAGLMDDEGAVVALSSLADGGPVLEFGVGTGRLAVPLAARGLAVSGVDNSEDMLAKLREKPGADKVTTIVGDMTTVRVEGEFALAFIAFNSIFVLRSQREQVDLFRNAAAHLRPGGRFVLETVVVGVKEGPNRRANVFRVEPDQVTLSAGIFDAASATYQGTLVVLGENGAKFYPISGRHVTHHEMDLMAELAGLELEHRWGDWKGAPFTSDSELHVSIYRKPS
jgi:SAM-dependent methyltransferase